MQNLIGTTVTLPTTPDFMIDGWFRVEGDYKIVNANDREIEVEAMIVFQNVPGGSKRKMKTKIMAIDTKNWAALKFTAQQLGLAA